MRQNSFPYCVPDQRDLTRAESELLDFLLSQIDDIEVSANSLKVVARCGCGECPTILFGESVSDDPITSSDSSAVMNWSGRADNGTLVGIGMFIKDGMPSELEAWSVDGGEVENWPPIDASYRI